MPEATAQQPQQRRQGRQREGRRYQRGQRWQERWWRGADIRGRRLRGMGVRSQGAGTGAETPKSSTPSRAEDIRAAIIEGACEEAAMGRCRRCLGLFLRLCPYVHMRMKGDSCTDFTNEQPCVSGRDEHGVSSGSHIQCFADAKSPGRQDG